MVKAIKGLNNYEGGYEPPTSRPIEQNTGQTPKIFQASSGFTGTQNLYTVPNGNKFILTRIRAQTSYAAGKSTNLLAVNSQFGPSITLWNGATDGTNQNWDIPYVYPLEFVEGTIFRVTTGGGNPDQVYTLTFEGLETSK